MITWLILGLYLLGTAIAFPKFVWVIAQDMSFGSKIEGDDLVFGCVVSLFTIWFWPFIWPCYRLHKSGNYGFIAQPPKHIRKETKRRQYEARIRELERECGIR